MEDPLRNGTSNKRSDYYKGWSMIVDIDGCLANWNDSFFDLLVELHGSASFYDGRRPQFTTWDWPRTECGYTQEQIDAAWDKVDDDWWYGLQPYPGAVAALQLLDWIDEAGKAQVTFCTGRYPTARNASKAWLDRYGFVSAHVITTSRKGRIAAALAANGPVAVIEDKPTLITEYANSTYVNHVYMIDQPYNRDVALGATNGYVHRMVSTLEAVKAFKALLEAPHA